MDVENNPCRTLRRQFRSFGVTQLELDRLSCLMDSSKAYAIQPKERHSFFQEMSICGCVEAFPGRRAFLQNVCKLWCSKCNHVFLVVLCFSFCSVQLGFKYLLMLRVNVVFAGFSWGETVALQLLSYECIAGAHKEN